MILWFSYLVDKYNSLAWPADTRCRVRWCWHGSRCHRGSPLAEGRSGADVPAGKPALRGSWAPIPTCRGFCTLEVSPCSTSGAQLGRGTGAAAVTSPDVTPGALRLPGKMSQQVTLLEVGSCDPAAHHPGIEHITLSSLLMMPKNPNIRKNLDAIFMSWPILSLDTDILFHLSYWCLSFEDWNNNQGRSSAAFSTFQYI